MMRKSLFVSLLLSFIFVLVCLMSTTFFASEVITAPGGEVKNYDELITALGGSKAATKKEKYLLITADIKLDKPIIFLEGEYIITGAGCEITPAFDNDSIFIVGDGEKKTSIAIGSADALSENDSIIFDGDNKTLNGSIFRIHQKSEVSVYLGTVFSNLVSDVCGGAIYNEGTFNMYGGKMENLLCTGSGGAIFNKGDTFLLGGSINNCSSEFGGAVYNEGKLELTGTEISSCVATKGGAVFNSGTLNFRSSTVKDCRSQNGGGVYNSGNADFLGGQIVNCIAESFGGGVYNSGTSKFTGIYLDKNSALSGGSVYNASNTEFSGGQIIFGVATEYGGNFYNDKTATLIVSGGIISSGKAKYGGGIFNFGNLTVTGGLVSSNKADVGEAILNDGNLVFKDSAQIEKNNDVCVIITDDNAHTVIVSTNLKAERVAVLSAALNGNEEYTNVYEEGLKLLDGDFVSETYNKFAVSSQDEATWLLSSRGSIYKQEPIYRNVWFYFLVLGALIVFVAVTVLVIRLYDKKIIRFTKS